MDPKYIIDLILFLYTIYKNMAYERDIVPGETINGFPSYLYFTRQSDLEDFIKSKDGTLDDIIEIIIASYLYDNKWSNTSPSDLLKGSCYQLIIDNMTMDDAKYKNKSDMDKEKCEKMLERLDRGDSITDVMTSFTRDELLWILFIKT